MIELKLKIEDIDYDSVADILAPALKDRIDSSEFPAWARLLFLAGGIALVLWLISKYVSRKNHL